MTLDDKASETEELFRQQALKHRMPELPKTGYCLNCSEKISMAHNFCCKECRIDFERRELQRKGR